MILSIISSLFGAGKKAVSNAADNLPSEFPYAPKKSFFTPKNIAIMVAIFLVLYFIFSSKKSKKQKELEKENRRKKAAEVKIAPPEDPNQPITQARKEDLKGFAHALFQDMEDTPMSGHTTDLYKKFSSSYFTDNEFTLICAAFNKIPAVVEQYEDEGFIRKWISGEVLWGNGATYKDLILQRMNRLGIKE